MKDINWAVLGTGVIANEMAVALKKNGKNKKQLHLVKSMASVKYIQITMRCLQIRKWMLSISQLLIIHIRNS